MPTALGLEALDNGGCAVVGEDGSAARLSQLVSVCFVSLEIDFKLNEKYVQRLDVGWIDR